MKKYYYLRNKTYGTYFRTYLDEGFFHYVIDKSEATPLPKREINKLLKELKHPENFEIIERNTSNDYRTINKN